jgi:hypothetical protein
MARQVATFILHPSVTKQNPTSSHRAAVDSWKIWLFRHIVPFLHSSGAKRAELPALGLPQNTKARTRRSGPSFG